MPAAPVTPEREGRFREREPRPEGRIVTAPEAKRLRKGMSPKTKMLLGTGLALTGAAAVVGGVAARNAYMAMDPGQKLDFANSMIGRTSWFPWLSGRIRSMRDAGIMAELNNPNAGAGLDASQRLALANRIIAGTGDSPTVQQAVVKARNAGIAQGWNSFSESAGRFFGSIGRRLGGGDSLQSLLSDVQRSNQRIQDAGMYSATPEIPTPRTITEPQIVPPPVQRPAPQVKPPPVELPGM